MSRINSRAKGANGEREFAKWLQEVLELPETPTRNLLQTREGGADIIDVEPFIFEVKRCEVLQLRKWWIKLVNQCTEVQVPVVAYRQNHKKWKFLISSKCIGLDKGYIQLEDIEFKQWAEKYFYANSKAI